MISKEQATVFADNWIAAWNARDMDAILSLYTDDFEMSSPKIVQFTGNNIGTLKGKENVAAYWRMALDKLPDLHFELIETLVGFDSVTLYYNSIQGKRAVEWFLFNEDGKVYKAAAHYN